MKLYHVYKKQFKKHRQDLCKNIGLAYVILFVFSLAIPMAFSYAQTAQDIRNKISQKDSDITKLEKEIANYHVQLDSLGQQKSSLSSSLKQLDLTRKKLNADIAVTQNKIDKTNLTIQNLSSDIGNKEDSIKNNTDVIKLELKSRNELDHSSLIENILSQDDFTVMWNKVDNMITLRENLQDSIITLKKIKGALEDTRTATIDAKNELTKLKSQLADQQKIVVQNTNEKNKLLLQTKNSEVAYQKLLQGQLAKKLAFEKELRDYESQLQFILDPSKLPSAGVLSWPLDSILMTSPYAPRWGGFHRGTDFRASVGTPVKAMAEGVVQGIGDTDICCKGASYGKWIFIEYNNGLSSTFAHLSLIKVQQGQKVKRGEVVGYSGNTGSSTGPHLHVSTYVSSGVKVDSFVSKSYPGKILTQPIAATNAHLDPMYYLPPYR